MSALELQDPQQEILTRLRAAGSQGLTKTALGITAAKKSLPLQGALDALLETGEVVNIGTAKKSKYVLKDMQPVVEIPPAEKMRRVLESQRQLGGDAYPVPLQRLLELAELPTNLKTFKADKTMISALGTRANAFATQPDNPVALQEDLQSFVASPVLLNFVLRLVHTKTMHCHSVATLKNKLASSVQKAFQAVVTAQMQQNTLPPHIGWISDKTPKLFFVEDLHIAAGVPASAPQPPVAAPAPSADPAEFPARFAAAFEKFDKAGGSHNFVSLVDLRRELAEFSREVFDAELRKLRIARTFTLSAAEGRHGITQEMQAAGILEGDSLLVYVLKV